MTEDLFEKAEKFAEEHGNKLLKAQLNWKKTWARVESSHKRDDFILMAKFCILRVAYKDQTGNMKVAIVTSDKSLANALMLNKKEYEKAVAAKNMSIGSLYVNPDVSSFGSGGRSVSMDKVRTFDLVENRPTVVTLKQWSILNAMTIPNRKLGIGTDDSEAFVGVLRALCGKTVPEGGRNE